MMPRQGKLLSYLTFLSVKEVLERGEKSKGILSRRQHWDNSVPDTLGSRSGFNDTLELNSLANDNPKK